MKNFHLLLLVSFLLSSPNLFAQGSSNQTIHFAYDNAGNQIQRFFPVIVAKSTEVNEEEVVVQDVTDADISQDKNLHLLEYYPNPVENSLTISWQKSINATVSSLQVYSMDYKLMGSFKPNKNLQEYTIPFNRYANGIYIIKVLFTNGKQDAFKIIKK